MGINIITIKVNIDEVNSDKNVIFALIVHKFEILSYADTVYWNIPGSLFYLFTFSAILIINMVTSAALQEIFSF